MRAYVRVPVRVGGQGGRGGRVNVIANLLMPPSNGLLQ